MSRERLQSGAGLVQAAVQIVGTRPLIWHSFGPDAIPLGRRERTGVAGNDPEEWRRTVLYTADRQLYLRPEAVYACLREGARYTRKGRGSIQPAVAATLQVWDDAILIDRYLPADPLPRDPQAAVYLDVRPVKNPSNRAANIRYRVACSAGWRTKCRLLWDPVIVDRAVMEAVAVDAGRFVGLGDGRKIGFGRFEVEAFEVSDA